MSELYVIRPFDPWKSPLCTCPPKYTLNPYTGCTHMCIYCYASSYIGRKPSTPKRDLVNRVQRDLDRILRRQKDPLINMSTSSDPYPPEERQLKLTRKLLEVFSRYSIRLLITTKSSLVTRDIELLRRIRTAVAITITTLDSNLARKLEPNAPSPNDRLRAIELLAREGIPVAVRVDPVIPYINDDPVELRELIRDIVSAGAKHVVTSTFKAKPDSFKRLIQVFPELESKLRRLYYDEGVFLHGYKYLRADLRKSMLRRVVELCKEFNITYAVCREGLPELRNAPSCDGSHLIPSRALS